MICLKLFSKYHFAASSCDVIQETNLINFEIVYYLVREKERKREENGCLRVVSAENIEINVFISEVTVAVVTR